MAKKNDVVLDEIDAFLEQEKSPKKKRSKKEVMVEEVKEEEKVEVVPEVKKRGRKKKEEVQVKEEVKEETVVPEVKEVKKEKKVKEKKKVTVDEEDLYLTQSFKPLKTKKRLKKGVIKFFRNLIIFGILGVLAFFGYTKVKEVYLMMKPINIYRETIKMIGDSFVSVIEGIPFDKNYQLDLTVDTNFKDYEFMNGNKMTYAFSTSGRGYEDYIAVNDKGSYYTVTDDSSYIKYTNSDKVIEIERSMTDFEDLIVYYTENKKPLLDMIKGDIRIYSDILEEDDIKTRDEVLTINGVDLDVKCHTVKIDQDLIDRYMEELFKDENLLDVYLELEEFDGNTMTVSELKESIKKDLEDEVKSKTQFNLYTYKLNVVGIDVEVDGFVEAYFYMYEDEFDLKINDLFEEDEPFRMTSSMDDKKDANIHTTVEDLKNFDFEEGFELSASNIEIKFNSEKFVLMYKKEDKYININVDISRIQNLNVNIDDVETNTKRINNIGSGFENNFDENESACYLLLDLIIRGEE